MMLNKVIFKQITFYLFIIILWQAAIFLKIWPEYIFPSPLTVISIIINGFKDFTFITAILISLRRIFIGYGIAVLLGIIFGILMHRFKIINQTFGSLVLGLQTLPSICWLPLALVWFGLNERAIIFVVIIGSLFSLTISTYNAIENIPKGYIWAGRNMGARKLVLLWEVIIPAAFPSIVSGLKQGWSFAWRSLMAGELLFVSLGLGQLLMMGRELNDMGQVMAVMFVIAFISILMDKIVFGQIELNIKRKWG